MAAVTETTRIAARVPAELVERLARVADADNRTVSYEIRQALKVHVERLEVERDVQPPDPDKTRAPA